MSGGYTATWAGQVYRNENKIFQTVWYIYNYVICVNCWLGFLFYFGWGWWVVLRGGGGGAGIEGWGV